MKPKRIVMGAAVVGCFAAAMLSGASAQEPETSPEKGRGIAQRVGALLVAACRQNAASPHWAFPF